MRAISQVQINLSLFLLASKITFILHMLLYKITIYIIKLSYTVTILSISLSYKAIICLVMLSNMLTIMARKELNKLRMEQLARTLEPYTILKSKPIPAGGWLRAVREALGRSVRSQAKRLGISSTVLFRSERAEVDGRITLAQLRKLAEGLDCEVVYALVPRRPLQDMLAQRAYAIAKQEVLGVAHTMALEEQRLGDAFINKQIEERKAALLAGSWSKLWR